MSRKYEYRPLNTGPDGDDYSPLQFERPPPKPPVKAITLAICLFALGSVLLIIGSMLLTGYIDPQGDSDRAIALIVIGAIVFIPGSYHVYLAYYAWKGAKGYSYSDIPAYDEDNY